MDKISAFMDGEASRIEAHQAVLRLKDGGECCETWETFHMIGDVMRGDHLTLRENFHSRFHEAIQREPSVLAPHMMWRKTANMTLAAAASLAGIAAVLTLVLVENPLMPQIQNVAVKKSEVIQVTQAPAPRPVPASNQARVNDYLRAHQEYSPSTTLQGVAPYIRTVSSTQDGGR